MRARLAVLVAALLIVFALPTSVGAGRGSIPAAAAEHARILAYWTPERIASAKWKDYERTPLGFTRAPEPNAKPGGGGSGAVTGASWTGDGIVEQRVGRILFSSGGSNWICSGTVVDDGSASNGYSVILTAGHCVYDGTDGWSSNFMFIPDFDDAPTYTCASTIHGCWTATRIGTNFDFVDGGGFGTDETVRVDYGFARFGPGGKSGSAELDAVTGGYGLKTTATPLSDTEWAFGYPAEGRYKGKDLIYCKGSLIADPYGADTWGIGCNMNGGSSGGGWLHGTSNPGTDGSKLLSSVNSYHYSGLTYMFGPKLNAEATTVLGDVVDGSATGGVSAIH